MTEPHLPSFVHDLLASPPHRGQGLNNWFFRAARVLHAFRSRDEIIELLANAAYGEPLQHNEIERAVERSAACAWIPGEPPRTKEYRSAVPQLDLERRKAIIAQDNITFADLAASSPVTIPGDGPRRTEEIIDTIFPGNPLLCVGKSKERSCTELRETWRGCMSTYPLIVPSPMTGAHRD
jgi:hypothetical protein